MAVIVPPKNRRSKLKARKMTETSPETNRKKKRREISTLVIILLAQFGGGSVWFSSVNLV